MGGKKEGKDKRGGDRRCVIYLAHRMANEQLASEQITQPRFRSSCSELLAPDPVTSLNARVAFDVMINSDDHGTIYSLATPY